MKLSFYNKQKKLIIEVYKVYVFQKKNEEGDNKILARSDV